MTISLRVLLLCLLVTLIKGNVSPGKVGDLDDKDKETDKIFKLGLRAAENKMNLDFKGSGKNRFVITKTGTVTRYPYGPKTIVYLISAVFAESTCANKDEHFGKGVKVCPAQKGGVTLQCQVSAKANEQKFEIFYHCS